ncbi:hypothetical protein CYY_003388 [Polysphondylium violaceum]|uniref:Uncharacterized protein n=1 Tax=Polysphondylium violaceum TaxID=133409 RepID=A0A8J4Q6W4_9MYCE|nr:hypothetical protein CYY_003388 [Polysphondylium violaceum]
MFIKIIVTLALIASVAIAYPQLCRYQGDCSGKLYCNQGFCTECQNDLDCKLNEFCSTNSIDRNVWGTCVKFNIDGKDCIYYEGRDLRNETISDTYKCAVTYRKFDNDVGRRDVIDKQGACVGGKCRICNYAASTDSDYQGEGRNAPRKCVFPGKYATSHSASWSSGEYYQEPTHVWLAIFFVFILIMTTVQVLGLFMKK